MSLRLIRSRVMVIGGAAAAATMCHLPSSRPASPRKAFQEKGRRRADGMETARRPSGGPGGSFPSILCVEDVGVFVKTLQ